MTDLPRPEYWVRVCENPATKDVKAAVEFYARAYLSELAPGVEIATEKLVEALFPRKLAEGSLSGDNTRTMIFKSIMYLAQHKMKDCHRRGEVSGRYMGKPKRPFLWYCPEESDVCPQCGQVKPKPTGKRF